MGTLHHQFQWLRSGLLSSLVEVPAQVTTGRPKEVVTPEIVGKIHGMILDDRRKKVREVAEAVGISAEQVLYCIVFRGRPALWALLHCDHQGLLCLTLLYISLRKSIWCVNSRIFLRGLSFSSVVERVVAPRAASLMCCSFEHFVSMCSEVSSSFPHTRQAELSAFLMLYR